jgi:threonine/homoserine/homoserine lactone efflux protein
MELHLWLSLVFICVLGALSPGPSLAVVIKNTLAGGHSQGYATAISHGIGVAFYAAITCTGIGIIIVQSEVIYLSIQYAGAAFLVYLGIKSLLSKKNTLQLTDVNASDMKKVNGWQEGFLISFLNPKLAIFFLALFSQFVDANASWQQIIIMTLTVGIIDALWYSIVTFTISRGKIINTLRDNSYIVDKITGGFLLLLAARVLVN